MARIQPLEIAWAEKINGLSGAQRLQQGIEPDVTCSIDIGVWPDLDGVVYPHKPFLYIAEMPYHASDPDALPHPRYAELRRYDLARLPDEEDGDSFPFWEPVPRLSDESQMIFFARWPNDSVSHFALHNPSLIVISAPPNDEFPDEIDSRPKYHLPKYWQYGRSLMVFVGPTGQVLREGEVHFRAREKRL